MMTQDEPEYCYYKRSDWADTEPHVVWRSWGRFCGYERWDGEQWVDDPEVFYRLQNEIDMWDATEEEVLAVLPAITIRHREYLARQEAERAEHREVMLAQRQAELEQIWSAKLDQPRGLPLSTLNQGAIAMHEMFLSMTVAGFTDDQALEIVIRMLLDVTGQDSRRA